MVFLNKLFTFFWKIFHQFTNFSWNFSQFLGNLKIPRTFRKILVGFLQNFQWIFGKISWNFLQIRKILIGFFKKSFWRRRTLRRPVPKSFVIPTHRGQEHQVPYWYRVKTDECILAGIFVQRVTQIFAGLHASRWAPFLRLLVVFFVVLIPLSQLLSPSNTLFLFKAAQTVRECVRRESS